MIKGAKMKRKGEPVKQSEGVYALDGKKIPYALCFKSVKNLNLRVQKDGSLRISVPHTTSMQQVLYFLSSHEDFLRRAFARLEDRREIDRPLTEQVFSNGVQFTLLERKIRLHILHADDASRRGKAILLCENCHECPDIDEIWHITVAANLAAEQEIQAVGRTVISEEINRLRTAVEQMIPRLGDKILLAAQEYYGISRETLSSGTPTFPNARLVLFPKQLKFRDMKSRWGSCGISKGIITINSRLIFSTLDCLEYVVCHELCHFFHPNHGKAYHALLQAVLPDAPQRRRTLNGK